MRVLHCCYRYFPERGGSETYTSALISGLARADVTSSVATVGQPAVYEWDGITVHRLGQAGSDEGFAPGLAQLLRRERPDVLHFHFFDAATSRTALPIARELRIPTVFTYHHPGGTCMRGDLLRFGDQPCSGLVTLGNCLPCVVHSKGVSRTRAQLFATVPGPIKRLAVVALPESRLRTAFGLDAALADRFDETLRFLRSVDCVMVLSEWSRDIMIRNGVAAPRIQLARLGTHHPEPSHRRPRQAGDARPLRGIFVGRLDATKGAHLLAAAMAQIPEASVEVDVWGPSDGVDPRLAPFLRDRGPGRLRFRGVLPDADVVETMAQYDFGVVCSQFLETGPFVVIEMFQAGLPVLGSDVPAISELVQHDHNGWLVPLHSASGWAAALKLAAAEPVRLERWRSNVSWPRTMDQLSREAAASYARLAGTA